MNHVIPHFIRCYTKCWQAPTPRWSARNKAAAQGCLSLCSSISVRAKPVQIKRGVSTEVTHLIPISVTANDNGFHPSRHQPGNVLADNSLPEDSATQDVSNCPIGRLPHLLQLELLHSFLIRSDGCTLYANVVFFYGFSSFHSYFIICSVTMLNAQVIAVTNPQR